LIDKAMKSPCFRPRVVAAVFVMAAAAFLVWLGSRYGLFGERPAGGSAIASSPSPADPRSTARSSVPTSPPPNPAPPSWKPSPSNSSNHPDAPVQPPVVQSLPDGRFVLRVPGGSELPPLSAAETEALASTLQAALVDAAAKRPNGPSWSPGQAAGPPDTDSHGDHRTAWAAAAADGGTEWLEVTFNTAVPIRELNIHETFNPGALARIHAVLPDGSLKLLWEGTTPAESESVERSLPIPPGTHGNRIRLELDTSRVTGWNEIDAVELVGTDGSRQWAAEATASSYYGQSTSSRRLGQ